MPQLAYTAQALDDLDRLAGFLAVEDPSSAERTAELVMQALEILEAHPLIGPEIGNGLRELVISRGQTGYVALYSYQPSRDRVLVHALRHQREVGFPPT